MKQKDPVKQNDSVKQASVMAGCSMMAALSVVILLIGGILELGMYACPMIAGLCILLVGDGYGRKYQIMTWIAVTVLGFILVPNIEENLMYLGVFGLYPIIYPWFQALPKGLRIIAKFSYFNVVVIVLELLLVTVFMPGSLSDPDAAGWIFWAALLAMGNVIFWCYDRLLPRMQVTLRKRFGRMLPR